MPKNDELDKDVAEALGLPVEEVEEPEFEEPEDEEPQQASADESDEEPEEAEPEPEPDLKTVMAELRELQKAKSGILNELRDERAARQAAEAERRRLIEEYQSQQTEAEKAKRAASRPDKDEDPSGYLEYLIQEQVGSLKSELESLKNASTSQAGERSQRELIETVTRDEERMVSEHPDYYDALEFVRTKRREIAQAMNPNLTSTQLDQWVAQGDQQFAIQALQAGQSPAIAAWEVANRMGYTPAQAGNGNGHAQPESEEPVRQAPTSLSAVRPASAAKGGVRKITAENWDSQPESIKNQILYDDDLMFQFSSQGWVRI